MPAPTKVYFAQIASGKWADWVEVVNVGKQQARLTAIARDKNGSAIWSAEHTTMPFQCWVVPAQGQADRRGEASLEVTSDQPILGERHCHLNTEVLDFPGAAVELDSAGTRLFFSEIAAHIRDYTRFLNIGETDAVINLVARNRSTGQVAKQLSGTARPKGWWDIGDQQLGNVTGTIETISTQPIVGERHSHYQGGKSAVGQLGQVLEGRMGPPRRIYFAQIAMGSGWRDWVIVTNVGKQAAKITAIARDQNGGTIWTGEKTARPYECWVVPAEGTADRKGDVSLEVRSPEPVVGERHCHSGSQVLSFPGAAIELGTIGTRLFYPELYSGAYDFIRFMNVGEAEALITVVARDRNTAQVRKQINGRARPNGFWSVDDAQLKSVTGTLEVISTQPLVGERHMHYQGGKTAISQLGQVIQ